VIRVTWDQLHTGEHALRRDLHHLTTR
jgi:hypothetical protein